MDEVINDYSGPRLIVTKRVTGPGAANPNATGPFTVRISCLIGGVPVTGFPHNIQLTNGHPVGLADIPAGGAASTQITYSDGHDAVVRRTRDGKIDIVNTFAATAPAAQLSATGTDITPYISLAAAALLAGTAFLFAARIRRRRRNSWPGFVRCGI